MTTEVLSTRRAYWHVVAVAQWDSIATTFVGGHYGARSLMGGDALDPTRKEIGASKYRFHQWLFDRNQLVERLGENGFHTCGCCCSSVCHWTEAGAHALAKEAWSAWRWTFSLAPPNASLRISYVRWCPALSQAASKYAILRAPWLETDFSLRGILVGLGGDYLKPA